MREFKTNFSLFGCNINHHVRVVILVEQRLENLILIDVNSLIPATTKGTQKFKYLRFIILLKLVQRLDEIIQDGYLLDLLLLF